MTYKQVMTELKKSGTAQNRKIYANHGASEPMFGVSCNDLGKLKKKIKVDHNLAIQLWDSGNVDAQVLATMIADPDQLKSNVVESWIKDVTYYLLSDSIAALVAQSPMAWKKMEKWTKSNQEFVQQSGYSILTVLLRDGYEMNKTEGNRILKTIEKEIHDAPNRARHSMNTAIMAIGIYMPSLTKDAIATAKKIGKVKVDHGPTACKTPDAVSYIEKALKRNKSRK